MKKKMKTFLTTTICLMAVLTVGAQNTSADKARVEKIRKMYADAKESIEYRKKAELPPDDLVATSNYMAAGAGPITDTTHYFYSGDWDEEASTILYQPYFITRSYNVGATKYYQEFLFDDDDLAFFYMKGENEEVRYYYGKTGLAHESLKGEERLMDDAFAIRLANDLKSAFNLMMNRNY